MSRGLENLLSGWASQWASNPRLRVGIWLAGGLFWVYAILMAADWTASMRASTGANQDQVRTIEPVTRSSALWAAREREVSEAAARLRALAWPGSERGIIEANVQDWLRAVAAKANLPLRELRILSELDAAPASGSSNPARPGSVSKDLPEAIRMRVVLEFRRQESMAWLVELARQEPLVAVDRLIIRTQTQPAVMEAEIRVLGFKGVVTP